MDKYSYKDVIIDPADPRVEIGKEYYFSDVPGEVISKALKDDYARKLIGISKKNGNPLPFMLENNDWAWACLIRKKETEKKYVPFKLSDRDALFKLMGCWLIDKDHGDYYCITAIYPFDERVYIPDYGDVSPEELLENFTFMFDGTPCGEEVAE